MIIPHHLNEQLKLYVSQLEYAILDLDPDRYHTVSPAVRSEARSVIAFGTESLRGAVQDTKVTQLIDRPSVSLSLAKTPERSRGAWREKRRQMDSEEADGSRGSQQPQNREPRN